jgi:hypothetical protein
LYWLLSSRFPTIVIDSKDGAQRDLNMDYRYLISNWHQKASGDDYFSKFIFEYLAFIAYLKTQLFESNLTDREAIQKLKQHQSLKEDYLRKIRSKQSLEEAWEHIKNKLGEAGLGNVSRDLSSVVEIKWWNCSHNDPQRQSAEERKQRTGVIHSLNDWENMIEFWHGIRNNLFHGAKNPENERDQFAVKYGYLTLSELVEIMLDGQHFG